LEAFAQLVKPFYQSRRKPKIE